MLGWSARGAFRSVAEFISLVFNEFVVMSGHHVEYVTSPPEWGSPIRTWDVHRLWKLAENLPVSEVLLADIPDLDRVGWYGEPSHCGRLTIREIAAHARRIAEADLSHPVLLSSKGFLFDGLHRVAKAWTVGQTHILAKRFEEDPAPDRIGPLPPWLSTLCRKRLSQTARPRAGRAAAKGG